MDNLTENHKEIKDEVFARTEAENKVRLKEVITELKDIMDMGLYVPNELRVESIVLMDYFESLKEINEEDITKD